MQPHLIDARRLIDVFAETDPRMPLLVFTLLSFYLADGPFEFNAASLAGRLRDLNMKARINPEELASLQPDIERFFIDNGAGWEPRPGVLIAEQDAASTSHHAGALPGALRPQTH
jgi:hypothetical protein